MSNIEMLQVTPEQVEALAIKVVWNSRHIAPKFQQQAKDAGKHLLEALELLKQIKAEEQT